MSSSAIFVAILSAAFASVAYAYRSNVANVSTTVTPTGATDNRDFCMHESFSARCQNGSLVLMLSAFYGRMRLGRCISGDFNVGCSTDVIPYFDAQCTGRRSCDVSVRNLIDIHPCQRDFTSYLDASYRCIQVAGWGLNECPAEGRIVARGSPGYLAHIYGNFPGSGSSSSPAPLPAPATSRIVGTELCPWTIIVHPGQTVSLRVIVLPMETVTGSAISRATGSGSSAKASSAAATSSADLTSGGFGNVGPGCSTAFVIREPVEAFSPTTATHRNRQQYNVCAGTVGGKSRERHLYTSTGNSVIIHVTSTRSNGVATSGQQQTGRGSSSSAGEVPLVTARFIISYEALGCPDMVAPPRAWLTRSGDNVVIRCNDTHETWYFTCQRGRWLGDAGNCSSGMQPLQHDAANDEIPFPSHGIMLAVLTGVTLGMVMGMVLLVVVHCARNRSRSRRKPRSGNGAATASVVKLSTCRGMSRSTNDDCAKLYSCGRTPSMPPLSVSSTYFRRGVTNEYDDDDDRLLFPGLLHPNGGSTTHGTRFQKAAVVYEFSCSGIDCPPSTMSDTTGTGNCCDLMLSKSKDGDHQTDTSVVTSSGSPTCVADGGHQLIDLCRRSANYAAQPPTSCDVSCHHHCVMCPIDGRSSPVPDGSDCCTSTASANDYACSTLPSRMRGNRWIDTFGNSSSPFELNYQSQQQLQRQHNQQQQQQQHVPMASSLTSATQLILYETANVGCESPSMRASVQPTPCDFRGYATMSNRAPVTAGRVVVGENTDDEVRGNHDNGTVGNFTTSNAEDIIPRSRNVAESCEVLVFD